MEWSIDKSKPICPQICEQMCVAISTGEFEAGSRLLSVREVALLAGVNPNTVQKSFEELERKGIIHSVRCSGWYVGEDITNAEKTLIELKYKKTAEYFAEMEQIGCDAKMTMEYLKEWYGGKYE